LTTCADVAARFVGLEEVPGDASNPLVLGMLRLDAKWVKGDDTPWCSAFVNFVAFLLGLPRSKSLAARSWLTVGRPIDLSEAQRGNDVVILKRGGNPALGHVGFFAGWAKYGSKVIVLGGNQADSVSLAVFSVEDVIGVRRLG
jgi:uncharacterized protein (TIGR02594 family)